MRLYGLLCFCEICRVENVSFNKCNRLDKWTNLEYRLDKNGLKLDKSGRKLDKWTKLDKLDKMRQSLDTSGFPAILSSFFVQFGQNGQRRGQKTWKPVI